MIPLSLLSNLMPPLTSPPATGVELVNIYGLVQTFIILLLVATGVALVSRRLGFPYVIGLVVAGLLIPKPTLPSNVGLNPELVLNLFLPILIFEAALNTDASRLKRNLLPIGLLAGPGTIVAALITGGLFKLAFVWPWIPILAAAVILTITDTVSVIAAFRVVPVPARLSTIVEGESLFNDAVALVLLGLITTVHSQGAFTPFLGLKQFLIAFPGGILLGLGLGYLCIGLFRQLEDPLSSLLLTVAVALGTFQVGTGLGVSGAIAVVTAGLVIGNWGLEHETTTAQSKLTLFSFWEYAAFGVNTFIFLLLGIEVDPKFVIAAVPIALLAIVMYQIGRAAVVYPFLYVLRWFDRPIPIRWQNILIIGNVKGSLSMAMALSLPRSMPFRTEVITLVFGTVLVSLIAQGLSLPWFVRKMKVAQQSESGLQIQTLQLNLMTAKAAQAQLKELLQAGSLPQPLHDDLWNQYQARILTAESELQSICKSDIQFPDDLGQRLYQNRLQRQLILAEKSAVTNGLRRGLLSPEIAEPYLQDLNRQFIALGDD
ncbi:sodium:proton antiporter [Thermosynechococcaceae cyanobacterium BACA0444]|uniref:Sodium:proton antiporter n=1 Tax=Pseudocalidococcus azoricus BACA0444 TaxID=2918990 RepID=A0AAE4FRZ6_9CYAN|nr:sodium:proton antiporter [Pseudocalidococcus azoricus]MDS3861065.1 sodium:proton antiporter [Pseudocalidococcus azoricus BACA0444]